MMRLKIAMIAIALLLIPVFEAGAQDDDDTVLAQPRSGRYAIEVPVTWAFTDDELRGLAGTFAGEIFAVADSEESLLSLQSNNRTLPITGQTLIANVFPTIAATGPQDITDPREIFSVILQEDAATATFFEVNGLSAVRVDTYNGPPYENQEFAGLTMILDGNLIYFVVYSGPDQASLDMLSAMASTLVANPVDNSVLLDPMALGSRDALTLERLQVPLIEGWMVLSSGPPVPGIAQMFMVIPEPALTLDRLIVPFFEEEAVPGMYVQVQAVPYDVRFGTADFTPTDDDRSQLLGETLAATGGEPELGAEQLTIDSQPALLLNVRNLFGGANTGQILLIDDGSTLYTLTTVAPTERWESDYVPLAAALTNGLTFSDAAFVDTAADEIPVGLQVGQRAPDFTLSTLDGQTVTLSELRGKVVLLNFWATWCPPCRIEMPEFEIISTERDDVEIVAVNLLETPDIIQEFVDELGLSFTIGLDLDGGVNDLFNVVAYPTTLIIDPGGVIAVTQSGPVTAAQIESWIEIASVP